MRCKERQKRKNVNKYLFMGVAISNRPKRKEN